MRIPDCYKALNIPPGADWDEVKRSYRVLARRYHPDLNRDSPGHEARFKTISQAYNKLERHYKTLQTGRVVRRPSPPAMTVKNSSEVANALQRVIDDYIPEKTRRQVQEWTERMKQHLFEFERKVFPLDVEKAVTLDIATAAAGGVIKVRTSSENFQVKIPATTQKQIELLIPEKGGKSFIKGRRGDLILKIRVVPGGVISPGTTNFFYEMTVPRENIDIGRVLTLNTIQGQIKFFVPRGTLDGQTFVLKAKPGSLAALKINHVLTLHVAS